VAAFGQAQTRESLELQQPNTTPSDQSQPDSNETFKAVSDELHEKVSDTKILTTTTETSTTPDAPDTSNEKVELRELDAIISSVIPLSNNVKVNGTTRHSDAGDVSLEMSSIERQISQVIVTVNETVRIDPAAQAVNKTTSSDEVDTVTNVPSRNTIGSRLLRNRITRLQTTTVRNVVPISRDSNEEGDSKKKTVKSDEVQSNSSKPVFGKPSRIRTTTTRNPIARDSDEVVDSTKTTITRAPVSRNRFNRIQTTTTTATTVRSDSVEQVEDSSSKTTTVRSLPSGNRFGRLRTTTVSTPTTTDDSKEHIDAVKTTPTKTARNSLSGSRFSRVRTTTVRATTSSDSSSAEREDLVTPVSTTQPTTVRGSLAGNRFGRFRATTTTAATTISKDSGEQDESVTPAPSTTTTRSLPRNRFSNFRGTTTSSPVSRDSDEQIDKVNVTQTTSPTTTTSRIFVPGNRLSRLRVTTTRSTSTSTANSDEDIDTTTATTTTTARNLRTGNRFSGRSRSTTTVPTTTTISSDSDERDDSVNGTTTTARSVSRGNRFNNRFRATTTSAPTTTTISKSSDEQEDSTVVIPSTTIRNSLLRNRFIRTTTVRVPTTTVEDSIEQEDVINGTQKINSTSAEKVTTVSAIKSSDSGEQDEMVNGTLTTTVRNLESEEKMDLVNSTQQVTTSRSSIFLKYFNRYRTTKASHSNSDDNSDEDEVHRANETSVQVDNSTSRQNFLNRLRSAAASLPAASNLTAPVTAAPLETTNNNLGRKDRAIIYNSAKSDNQLITSTMSTVHVEPTRSTPPMTAPLSPPPPGFYTFGSSDEIDDTSEDDDEDASRTPYFDPFYGVPLRESSAGVPSKVEENSLEVEDVSSEMELNSSVTVKPEDESSEITMSDMVSSKGTDVQHVYLHPNVQDDVSVEMVITVPNHPTAHHDVQNQTLMAQQQHAFNFATAESDEGNDGSVEEKEGSGDAVEEDQNVKNSTTPVQEKSADPVKESDEGNSKEKEGSGDVPEDANFGGNDATNTTRVDEVSANNSDENDENSSLEIDLSKLTDIQRALTDVKPDEVVIPDVVPELQRFFTDANKPVELFLEDRNHQTTTIASVPTKVTRNRNESVIRPTPSNDEVTMKLKELLTNPVVQQRLEAIDGRLKSTKSARVKRLIEKYLAALAKLSTNSASTVSTSSFSIFLPLLITCFLFGFS
jgi:hypothetical protein